MNNDLGKIIRYQRIMIPLTLKQLSVASGVSTAHLARVESGKRFPSARVLRKIAKPLGLSELELFAIAGYLPPQPPPSTEAQLGKLDPYVARVLSGEPLQVQHTVIAILNILKSIAKEEQ